MIEFLLCLGFLYLIFPKNNTNNKPKNFPIVVKGTRSPMYYDIMEEEYAPFKQQLQEDAKNGVIYKRSKSMPLIDFLNKVEPKYEDFPASQALKEFEEYERNGYM